MIYGLSDGVLSSLGPYHAVEGELRANSNNTQPVTATAAPNVSEINCLS